MPTKWMRCVAAVLRLRLGRLGRRRRGLAPATASRLRTSLRRVGPREAPRVRRHLATASAGRRSQVRDLLRQPLAGRARVEDEGPPRARPGSRVHHLVVVRRVREGTRIAGVPQAASSASVVAPARHTTRSAAA